LGCHARIVLHPWCLPFLADGVWAAQIKVEF
jgi:hypothetical protein